MSSYSYIPEADEAQRYPEYQHAPPPLVHQVSPPPHNPYAHPADPFSEHASSVSGAGPDVYGNPRPLPSPSHVVGQSSGPLHVEDSADDIPLVQRGGQYAFAPATHFDDTTAAGEPPPHHMPNPYFRSSEPAEEVEDDDDIDGQARGRLLPRGAREHSDAASANSYGFAPAGFDPRIAAAHDPYGEEEGSDVHDFGGHESAVSSGGVRYGMIPQRVPRRYKTLKRVELYHGNLVLDCPVPSKLLEKVPDRESREFTHMRYTAATCDPNDFKDERYTLRQVLFDPPRRTELFIVMTMYNEDEGLFTRTMHGVMKNISHLCTRDRSKTWGKEGWKKVVVCIVSDGRKKINSRTLSTLAAMGVYQEGVAKNVVNGKPVTAHIYEYTTQLSIDPDLKFRGAEKGIVPVQILFCLKERNQKKINSHRWFFNAFGPVLQPNVCVLLDVGTMPGPRSIYHLWKAFDINSNIGGACGEIVALKGKYLQNLINPLVAAQNFEYKMSNILDKPLESVFGYISVLPGAFSAYRYIALQNDATGRGPLNEYFKGETLHGGGSDADIFTSNMYLAEDRILCWELCSKRDCAWVLHYVKSAYAITDVPDQVPELISQRRRWLNGSFFASVHSIVKFGYIYRSSHSFLQKFWFHVELLYQVFSLVFSWFALGNYYIAFVILTESLEDPSFGLKGVHVFNVILQYIYLALLVFNFLLSMGNRPQGSKVGYTGSMIAFALITVYMTFAAIFLAVKGILNAKDAVEKDGGVFNVGDMFSNSIFRNIVISLVATYGLYLVASIMFLDPWHLLTSFFQYLLLAPSFINVINIYAFCNTHDVSWGTKGSDKVSTDLGVVQTAGKNQVEVAIPTEQKDINEAYDDACHVLATKAPKVEDKVDPETKQTDYYRSVRTNVVLAWTLSNAALAIAILNTTGRVTSNGKDATVTNYMAFLLFSVAGLAFIRLCGSTTYLTKRLFAGE